jgi:hypothetical protein
MPLFTLAAAATISLPAALSGQEMAAIAPRAAAATPVALPEVSFNTAAAWKAYANELVREAGTLPAGSEEKLQMIRTAANIKLNFGDAEGALDLIVGAAEAAEVSGSVALAAHTFIDGAWIASEMELQGQVNQLAERATMLTISPLMGDADRVAVLRRVERSGPSEMAAR